MQVMTQPKTTDYVATILLPSGKTFTCHVDDPELMRDLIKLLEQGYPEADIELQVWDAYHSAYIDTNPLNLGDW